MDLVTTSATAKQVHDDIEEALGTGPTRRETRTEAVGALLKNGGASVWRTMKRHPFLAMATVAVAGVALATSIGAAELWFGGALAFAAYKVLREGEPPVAVLREIGQVIEKEL
jgi:hypothetical protein